MTERTELESCVLGVVWLRGPCTAYVVRQEFTVSRSSHWTGSAGAIYPLLRRLAKSGLIRARKRTWGRGGKQEFSITPRGLETLRAWIGPPLPPWTAAPAFDPVRTRLTFLMAVPKPRRRRFIAAALENLDAEIAAHERDMAEAEGLEKLVTLGALRELEGRRRWLGDVKKAIG